jgi:hypothetical protein
MADQFNDSIPAVTNQITEDVADIAETLGYIKDVFQNIVKTWNNTVATTVFVDKISDQSATPVIQKCLVLDIGDWNMDANANVSVAHGLGASFKKIRSITSIIRNDADDTYSTVPSGASNDAYIASFNTTAIGLTRVGSGGFDNSGYDSTSFNRGWIVVWYIV